MLEHTGQTGHADMLVGGVDDVLIHLVGDDKGIVLQRELCDGLQLIAAIIASVPPQVTQTSVLGSTS